MDSIEAMELSSDDGGDISSSNNEAAEGEERGNEQVVSTEQAPLHVSTTTSAATAAVTDNNSETAAATATYPAVTALMMDPETNAFVSARKSTTAASVATATAAASTTGQPLEQPPLLYNKMQQPLLPMTLPLLASTSTTNTTSALSVPEVPPGQSAPELGNPTTTLAAASVSEVAVQLPIVDVPKQSAPELGNTTTTLAAAAAAAAPTTAVTSGSTTTNNTVPLQLQVPSLQLQSHALGKRKKPLKRSVGRPKKNSDVDNNTTGTGATFGKRRTKRRGSNLSGKNASNNNGNNSRRNSSMILQKVDDCHAARLVNPLLVVDNRASAAAELLPLLDLTYPDCPDTFSIAYVARLLGFDVPVVVPTTSTATSGSQNSVTRKDIVQRPLLLRDAGSRQIPTKGTFAKHVWLRDDNNDFASLNTTNNNDHNTANATKNDSDALLQKSGCDPLYVSLLAAPPVSTTAVTAAQQSRHLQPVDSPAVTVALNAVLQASHKMLPMMSNTTAWQSLQQFGRQHGNMGLAPSHATSHAVTGLFLLEPDIPSALVVYQFQWVPLEQTLEQKQQQQAASVMIGQSAAAAAVSTDAVAAEPAFMATVANNTATTTAELVLQLQDLRGDSRSYFGSTDDNPLSLLPQDELYVLVLTALCLEHARTCNVWYAVAQVPPALAVLFERYFRMSRVATPKAATDEVTANAEAGASNVNITNPQGDGAAAGVAVDSGGGGGETKGDAPDSCRDMVHMVCDLHKCSYRYAFLLYQQDKAPVKVPQHVPPCSQPLLPLHRWLVRLPNAEDVKAAMQPPDVAAAVVGRPKRAVLRKASPFLSGGTLQARQVTVRVRAKLQPDALPQLLRLDAQGQEGAPIESPAFYSEPIVDILRDFALPSKEQVRVADKNVDEQDDLVRELMAKQQELDNLEMGLEPSLRTLLGKVVDERLEYESVEAECARQEEKRILLENKKMLERRQEMDMVWQKQLEQDMDAVCAICDDGEVTPDNQILFCESCNVAVHQFCYGIERVPEGDYYCLACTHLGRNRTGAVVARDPDAPKASAAPLTICCELCPLKQGAFIRTNMKPKQDEESAFGKWVHVLCAKWQGLNFVDNQKQDLVEDVSDLKVDFRRSDVNCQLCLGNRGAMNQCRFLDCQKWIHITCARAAGTCDVVHGENARGPVGTNPWSLVCPEHSDILQADIPKDAIRFERLIAAAREFPPEPVPPPLPVARKPFNSANGMERKALLAENEYEQELLWELLHKKLFGVRCEVCDRCEENGKNVNRCDVCNVMVCRTCTLEADVTDGSFKCASCYYTIAKGKEGDDVERPSCVACYQKGGVLRQSVAHPMKKTHWVKHPSEFKRSLFGRDMWIHSLCAFYNPGASVSQDTGVVDLSNLALSNGKAFVHPNISCFLCGNAGGLKMKCNNEGCRVGGDNKSMHVAFHVTCARQAGLEVNSTDDRRRKTNFYLKCYRHGGNEYNLRARLEDLLEIEKRRSGKYLTRADQPMKFADASRLLNASILVTRILGWAWRWSEWWVDYNSTWEPLLEPGEREEDMTPEQLRIVESTRESRCEDARKCRLTAFGAALRKRAYDTEDGFERDSLDRALRAVLHTKSLVGPLTDAEIDFFAEWLARAYRSKSPLLGFQNDKIVDSGKDFCAHMQDQSAKSDLGCRSVPGTQRLLVGQLFEFKSDAIDDFLQTEVIEDDRRVSPRRIRTSSVPSTHSMNAPQSPNKLSGPGRKRARSGRDVDADSMSPAAVTAVAPLAAKKRLGRPPKDRSGLGSSPVKKRLGRPPKNRKLEPEPDTITNQFGPVKRKRKPVEETPVADTDPETIPRAKYRPGTYPRKKKPVEELPAAASDLRANEGEVPADADPGVIPPVKYRPGTYPRKKKKQKQKQKKKKTPVAELPTAANDSTANEGEVAPDADPGTIPRVKYRPGTYPRKKKKPVAELPAAANDSPANEGEVAPDADPGTIPRVKYRPGTYPRKKKKPTAEPLDAPLPAAAQLGTDPALEPGPPEKRRGRLPQNVNALTGQTADTADVDGSDDVHETRSGRSLRSPRTDQANVREVAVAKNESVDGLPEAKPPKKRLGRPPKIRPPAESEVSIAALAGGPASIETLKPHKKRLGRPPKIRPPVESEVSVAALAAGSTSIETHADSSSFAEAADSGDQKPAATCETSPMTRRRGSRRGQEVSPVKLSSGVSKFDVVKRRRGSVDLMVEEFEDEASVSSTATAVVEPTTKRKRSRKSEDDMTIADFVAKNKSSSRPPLEATNEQSVATVQASDHKTMSTGNALETNVEQEAATAASQEPTPPTDSVDTDVTAISPAPTPKPSSKEPTWALSSEATHAERPVESPSQRARRKGKAIAAHSILSP